MKALIVAALIGLTATTAYAQPRPATNLRSYEDHSPAEQRAYDRGYEDRRAEEARRDYYEQRREEYYDDRYHNEYRPAGYRYVDGYSEPQPQPRQEARGDVGAAAILGFIAGAVVGTQLDHGHHRDGYGRRW